MFLKRKTVENEKSRKKTIIFYFDNKYKMIANEPFYSKR